MVFKTCREEILYTVKSLLTNKGKNEFTIKEVIELMNNNNTVYKDGTIRTHINSRCCSSSADHHGTTYSDFTNIRRGLYKLITVD